MHTLLEEGAYALDFQQSHYDLLLKKLEQHTEDQLNQQKSSIRQGILNYFHETYQLVTVDLFKQELKIAKEFDYPEYNERIDRIIHANNLQLIQIRKDPVPFSPMPHLIKIPETIREAMFNPLLEQNLPIDSIRRITRQEANKIFELDERDIILFLRGKIAIRSYVPPKKFPAGTDKRYNGELPEEMEAMYHRYFPKGCWKEIEDLLSEVLPEQLNFSTIDNNTFSRTFIPVFRSMIELLLSDLVHPNDYSKIEGFTGFVLRQNFDDIMLYTASNLLDYIEKRDKNAETFIKYFTEDIIIDAGGNKIQKFPIMDKKGQKWNYSSILSVVMQWKQSQKRIAAQMEMVQMAQATHAAVKAELQTEKNYAKQLTDQLEEIDKLLMENDHESLKIKAQMRQEDSPNAGNLKTEYAKIMNQYDELQKQQKSQKNKIESESIKVKNKATDVANKKKKVDYELKTLEGIKAQIEPIRESYELISHALAIVLSKR